MILFKVWPSLFSTKSSYIDYAGKDNDRKLNVRYILNMWYITCPFQRFSSYFQFQLINDSNISILAISIHCLTTFPSTRGLKFLLGVILLIGILEEESTHTLDSSFCVSALFHTCAHLWAWSVLSIRFVLSSGARI